MIKTNRTVVAITVACLVVLGSTAYSQWWPFSGASSELEQSDAVLAEINWGDLVPDDFVQPEDPFRTMSQEEIDKLMDGSEASNAELDKLREAFNYAPVVEELNGKRVKIAAYITPLEFSSESLMSEFLLVPYVGACMHTPPPPANQVVHAQAENLVAQRAIYEPVWAIGTIYTETVRSNLAESGYRLEVERVLEYEL